MKTPSLFAIALLASSMAYSQAKVPVVQTSATLTAVKPAALNMKQVKLSSAFASRQQLYGSSFTNPTKRITYSDGTALNIQLIKNPSFGDQSTNITAHVSGGGPVHTST